MSKFILVLSTFALLGSFSVLAVDPNFEFVNKHNKPVWITVQEFVTTDPAGAMSQALKYNKDPWPIYGENRLSKRKVDPNQRASANIVNLKNMVRLLIGFSENVDNNNFSYKYSFLNSPGLTKYLTFNPAKSKNCREYLYPQTGTLLSLASIKELGRTTESGYSLSKNIKPEHIDMEQCISVALMK